MLGKGFFLLGDVERLGHIQCIHGIWELENRWDIYNLSMGWEKEGEEEPLRLWDHLNPRFLG